MSRENVKNFYEMLKVDANLAQELMKLKEELEKGDKKFLNDEYVINEKIIPLAKKHGFDFTADEFTAYSKEQLSKLSEEELLNVTGGTGVVGAIGGVLLSIFSMFGFGANSTTSIPDTVIEGTTSTERDNTVGTPNEEGSSESFKEINSSIDNVSKKLVPDLKSKLENNKTENIEYKSGDVLNLLKDDIIKNLNENINLLKKDISYKNEEILGLKEEISELQKDNQDLRLFSEQELLESFTKEKNELIEQLKQLKKEKKSNEQNIKESRETNDKLNKINQKLTKDINKLKKEINKLKEDHEEEKHELLNDAVKIMMQYHDSQTIIEKNMSEYLSEIDNENEGNRKALNEMKEKINDYDNGKKQVEEDLERLTKDKEDFNKEKEDFKKEKAKFDKLKEEATYTSFTSSKLDEQARHLINFLRGRNFNLDITNQALMKDIKHVVGQLWKDSKGIVYLHSQGIWKGIGGTDYYANDVSGVSQTDLDALYNLKTLA